MTGLSFIREEKKMTMQELGEKIGVTKATISKWESNKSTITDENMEKLVNLFGVSKEFYQKEVSETDKLRIKRQLGNHVIEEYDIKKSELKQEICGIIDDLSLIEMLDLKIQIQLMIKTKEYNELKKRLNKKG